MNIKRILTPLLIILLASTIAFGANIPLGPYFDDTYFDLSDSALILKVVPHEKGGLEADVSAYDGLILITGGATSNLTIGIGDDNIVEMDDVNAAVNDYCKLTANGIVGRSYSETMKDLNPITIVSSAHAMTVDEAGTVLVSGTGNYTIGLPTAVGNAGLTYHFVKTDYNYNLITLDGDGGETFNYENSAGSAQTTYSRLNTPLAEVTIISDGTNWQVINEAMGQVPLALVCLSANQTNLSQLKVLQVCLDTEIFDVGGNFDNSVWVSGNADGTVANHLQDDGASQFTAAMVGFMVKNTTDTTYTYITACNDAGDVTITDNIFVNGEGYEIKHSKFVVPVPGKYKIEGLAAYNGTNMVADKTYSCIFGKDYDPGNPYVTIGWYNTQASKSDALAVFAFTSVSLSINEVIEMKVYQASEGNAIILTGSGTQADTNMMVKLISKD